MVIELSKVSKANSMKHASKSLCSPIQPRPPGSRELFAPALEVFLDLFDPLIADHIRHVTCLSNSIRRVKVLHNLGKNTHKFRVGVEGLGKGRGSGWGVVYPMFRDIFVVDLGWEGLVNILVLQEEWKSERSRQVDVHLLYHMEGPPSSLVLDRRYSYVR